MTTHLLKPLGQVTGHDVLARAAHRYLEFVQSLPQSTFTFPIRTALALLVGALLCSPVMELRRQYPWVATQVWVSVNRVLLILGTLLVLQLDMRELRPNGHLQGVLFAMAVVGICLGIPLVTHFATPRKGEQLNLAFVISVSVTLLWIINLFNQ